MPIATAESTPVKLGTSPGRNDTVYRQHLQFDVADEARIRATLYASKEYSKGDRIPVIHVPGQPHISAYVGVPSREELAGHMEHYNDDVERVFHERALSGRQVGFATVAWLLIAVDGTWILTRRAPSDPSTVTLTGSRTARGTFRSGRVVGDGLTLPLSGVNPALRTVSSALEGRQAWFCWDPRVVKDRKPPAKKGKPGPRPYRIHPAVVIFDSGYAVYGHFRVPGHCQAEQLGAEIGGARAPQDPSGTRLGTVPDLAPHRQPGRTRRPRAETGDQRRALHRPRIGLHPEGDRRPVQQRGAGPRTRGPLPPRPGPAVGQRELG